jgi:hypothetical protein
MLSGVEARASLSFAAHGDVRRPQIPNVAVQPVDVLGKVQYGFALTKMEDTVYLKCGLQSDRHGEKWSKEML